MVGPLVRPELRAWTARWSEALVAVAILLAGSWLALRGGWFFAALGAIAVVVGLSLLIGALRRMPFRRRIDAPGLVEVDEGAIRYFGASVLGGEIALRDLVEIRLLRLKGRCLYRVAGSRHGRGVRRPGPCRGPAGRRAHRLAETGLRRVDLARAARHL